MTSDCRPAPARRRVPAWLPALAFAAALAWSPAIALGHAHAVPAAAQGHAQEAPAQHGVEPVQTEEHHEEGILPTVARLFNFAILAGVLVYFLKTPIAAYLASRGMQIRQDLVTAAETRAAATAQLAEIEAKLKTLPAELDTLKARGAEDLKAEQERIAAAAAAERERLVDQTRREIEMRLRIARRELTEHAAALAIKIAEERLKRAITPEDNARLVDRYAAQLQEAR